MAPNEAEIAPFKPLNDTVGEVITAIHRPNVFAQVIQMNAIHRNAKIFLRIHCIF